MWRASKTPPAEARYPLDAAIDEIDHSIHEAVGEWAETIELFCQAGPSVVVDEQTASEMLAELGDCMFTLCWLMHSLGFLVPIERQKIADSMSDTQVLNKFRGRHMNLAMARPDVIRRVGLATPSERAIVEAWMNDVHRMLLVGASSIGKIADQFKKVRWHNRVANTKVLFDLLGNAVYALECICVLCGTTAIDAALANIEKLNKRYPNGYELGGGKR